MRVATTRERTLRRIPNGYGNSLHNFPEQDQVEDDFRDVGGIHDPWQDGSNMISEVPVEVDDAMSGGAGTSRVHHWSEVEKRVAPADDVQPDSKSINNSRMEPQRIQHHQQGMPLRRIKRMIVQEPQEIFSEAVDTYEEEEAQALQSDVPVTLEKGRISQVLDSNRKSAEEWESTGCLPARIPDRLSQKFDQEVEATFNSTRAPREIDQVAHGWRTFSSFDDIVFTGEQDNFPMDPMNFGTDSTRSNSKQLSFSRHFRSGLIQKQTIRSTTPTAPAVCAEVDEEGPQVAERPAAALHQSSMQKGLEDNRLSMLSMRTFSSFGDPCEELPDPMGFDPEQGPLVGPLGRRRIQREGKWSAAGRPCEFGVTITPSTLKDRTAPFSQILTQAPAPWSHPAPPSQPIVQTQQAEHAEHANAQDVEPAPYYAKAPGFQYPDRAEHANTNAPEPSPYFSKAPGFQYQDQGDLANAKAPEPAPYYAKAPEQYFPDVVGDCFPKRTLAVEPADHYAKGIPQVQGQQPHQQQRRVASAMPVRQGGGPVPAPGQYMQAPGMRPSGWQRQGTPPSESGGPVAGGFVQEKAAAPAPQAGRASKGPQQVRLEELLSPRAQPPAPQPQHMQAPAGPMPNGYLPNQVFQENGYPAPLQGYQQGMRLQAPRGMQPQQPPSAAGGPARCPAPSKGKDAVPVVQAPRVATKQPKEPPTHTTRVPPPAGCKDASGLDGGVVPGSVSAAGRKGFTWDTVRTLMVRNIPGRYTQEMLLAEWTNEGTYDLLYLPICFDRKRNSSFAFINFTSSPAAVQFYQCWHKQRLTHHTARKSLDISWADVQGRDENIMQIIKNKAFRIRNAHFQPVIFEGGNRISMEEFMTGMQDVEPLCGDEDVAA